jgi:signal transduction histidine kinase
VTARRSPIRPLAQEAAVVVLAAADAWTVRGDPLDWRDALVVVGVVCLPLRHRVPFVTFAIALVAAVVAPLYVVPIVAMYTVSVRCRTLAPPLAAAAALATAIGVSTIASGMLVAGQWQWRELFFVVGYSLVMVGAPLAFGRLVRARRELTAQLAELTAAQEDQRRLHEHTVLARERAQLAREMHDVVSHQVSLIAVEAGALQVVTDDATSRESARSIRTLAVSTLDELRHMVGILRTSGSEANGLAPQPTARDIPRLLAASGIDVGLSGELPEDLSPAVARAVYRTTQEALTNARKHAPGASVEIMLEAVGRGLRLRIVNDPPVRVALDLPGAKVGLLGLRERAESLGGTLESGSTDCGGYAVILALPDRSG